MINISLLFAFDQTLNYARWRICKIEIRPCTSHIAYVRVEVFRIFLRIFMGIFQVFFCDKNYGKMYQSPSFSVRWIELRNLYFFL